ncbi:hypothetical protein EVAR_78808_1 [Eumeta japonica]|uniref:Uncharacterized protein n=1 Tax=Eumeta variegata TaxID=151549 RepID=A0A4C1T4F7_EUMVA|nr:hypothetical protein EVAR_78808_1 [Eumeta japonica]
MKRNDDDGDGRWVYSYDPEIKRQSAHWVFPLEELPTEVKRGRSVRKKMVVCFFTNDSQLQSLPVPITLPGTVPGLAHTLDPNPGFTLNFSLGEQWTGFTGHCPAFDSNAATITVSNCEKWR